MKKIVCLLLSLALILAGCTVPPDETTAPPPETTLPPESTASTQPVTETVNREIEYLRENLPTMDGSTSLIPLEAGIRAALFGKTIEEATLEVSHTTTWGSYWNLLSDQVDMIFSCPLSQEQYDQAEAEGFTLELVPVAMEGFVFVVNAQNPVDSLTQQQLRDIYSGKITNWSQVGGLDEEIIPYQRNRDSGSQNFMTEFMGDTPLMDAPSQLRPASMSGLMDVIAVNDNSRAAIGYSVYAYAANMYGNGNEIKFIQVDGVAPSRETFANRSYPLLGMNYAVFNADEPAGSPVRRLADWIASFDGQTAVAQAGYVTVTDIGFDYQEMTLSKYEGTGTGPAPGEAPATEYVMLGTGYNHDGSAYSTTRLTPPVSELSDGTKTYRITQLADTELEAEINSWIDEQMIWAAEERAELEAVIENLNQGYDYGPYNYGLLWDNAHPQGMDAACIVTAKNGYLSVAISLCYTQNVMDSYEKHYRTETATWDLLTGKRLGIEDLFCEGVDIDEVLSEYIRVFSQTPRDYYGFSIDLKQDFAGLPADGWHITHDTIYFDYNNPYFADGEPIPLDELPDGTLSAEALRDFSQCFDPNGDAIATEQFRISDRDTVYTYNSDGYTACALLKEDAHPNAGKINREVMTYLNTHYTEDAIRTYFDQQGFGYDCDIDTGLGLDWTLSNWGGRYLLFQGSSPMVYDGSDILRYPYPSYFLYDLESGEPISWQELLRDGWQEECPLLSSSDGMPIENPDFHELEPEYLYYGQWDNTLRCHFTQGCYLEIPFRFIRL